MFINQRKVLVNTKDAIKFLTVGRISLPMKALIINERMVKAIKV